MSEAEIPRSPGEYRGPDGASEWIEDYAGVSLTREQREMARAVSENRYLLIYGANGFGKTWMLVCLAAAFFYTRYPSSVAVTSGTYGKLQRTFCSDFEWLHGEAKPYVPGEWKMSPNPHLDVDGEPTWQFEVASPADPGEFEGMHNRYTLSIVEEADKDDVTLETIDSMESLVTDERDRMVVVANPPETEADVVHELRGDDKYEVLSYSSFDSHNVRAEMGEREGERVDGLAGVTKLRDDWESYNQEPWPGVEEAMAMSDPDSPEFRDDLSARWYRRRAGIVPPGDTGEPRAITDSYDVERTSPDLLGLDAVAMGVDVARRGGDDVALAILGADGDFRVLTVESGDHVQNEDEVAGRAQDLSTLDGVAVDAVGEGSGLADRLSRRLSAPVHRFKSGKRPHDRREDDYQNQWTAGLVALGDRLSSGATVLAGRDDTSTGKELGMASRACRLRERQRRSGDVEVADPKSDVKERLGWSPDRLDALVMCAYVATGGSGGEISGSRHSAKEIF